MMKSILFIFPLLLASRVALGQEHGHTHGSGGEAEHMFPILGVFAVLIVVGGIFYFINMKKK